MPFGGIYPHYSFFIVRLLACLICLPALITIACDRRVDGPVPSYKIKSPWVRGRRHLGHPAPRPMPFNKSSSFLATTAMELALLLGYGGSQYTGH